MLALDGYQVQVLERDPEGPGGAGHAWQHWQRPGVAQFRFPHVLAGAGTSLLRRELPAVMSELERAGASTHTPAAGAWTIPVAGGHRPGDERFDSLGARRPVLEAALAAVADRTRGITVSRGVTVSGLTTGHPRMPGRPHVNGVVTVDGRVFLADLVVDAGGRNSRLGRMLAEIGAPTLDEERAETGFIHYGRYFEGLQPEPFAWPLDHYDSLSTILLPGDNGTWSVVLVAAARDHDLRALQDPEAWQRAAALFPPIAPWAAGRPISDVLAMSGSQSRRRELVRKGRPVASGVINLGDAWATTNLAFTLGMTIGLTHAVLLRDQVRGIGLKEPEALTLRLDEATRATLTPIYRRLRAWDEHRLAELLRVGPTRTKLLAALAR